MSDLAWQWVTCSQCAAFYQCTPQADYYNATTDDDGVCETCLFGDLPVHTITVDPLTSAALRAGVLWPSRSTPSPTPTRDATDD